MNRKLLIGAGFLIATIIIVTWLFVFGKPIAQPAMRSFPLLNLTGPEAADIIAQHVPEARIDGWNDNTVFVRGRSRHFEAVTALLRQEDKPAPPVALRFQLIEANGFAGADSSIAAVESVLRGLFRFQGYRLAAEAFVRTKKQSHAEQSIVGNDGTMYLLSVNVHDVQRREGKASAELSINLLAPSLGPQPVLTTTVNVPDGQTVVLGTARPDAKRGAMILVVTTEIR